VVGEDDEGRMEWWDTAEESIVTQRGDMKGAAREVKESHESSVSFHLTVMHSRSTDEAWDLAWQYVVWVTGVRTVSVEEAR